MPYARITVPLSANERQALLTLAEHECRDPREHMRYLLREELQRRGLIERTVTGSKRMAAFECDEHTRDDQATARTTVS